jgi:hypothetical protein
VTPASSSRSRPRCTRLGQHGDGVTPARDLASAGLPAKRMTARRRWRGGRPPRRRRRRRQAVRIRA